MQSLPALRPAPWIHAWLSIACLLGMTWQAHAEILVATNSSWRLFRGTAEPAATRPAWRQPGFNDSAWPHANAPFSYGDGVATGTVLSDMRNRFSTLYLRTSFQLPTPSAYARITLRVASDDGFVAYLNGREVARYNCAPGDRPFNDHAAPDHATTSVAEPIRYNSYNVPVQGALVAGENTLALHGFNDIIAGIDFFLDAELSAAANEAQPPVIASVRPPPGDSTNLSTLTVTFSEQVTGVDAGDLLLNGQSATAVRMLNPATYEFDFTRQPYGPVEARWNPNHGIADTAVTPNPFAAGAPGASWAYLFLDPEPPVLAERLPPAGFVRQLSSVLVRFSEPVQGVDAADLLVNGQPASAVSGIADGPYLFTFPAQPHGPASIAFAAQAAITDVGSRPLAFQGASWSVFVDPERPDPSVRINEVVAANATGIKDEDGEEQPWIELFNPGPAAVNLANLALSDSPDADGAWVFPSMSLGAGQYLVVFASGKDRRDPAKGRLHASFRLAREGEFVGLFNAESPRRAFGGLPAPYPAQRNDVAWARTAPGEWAFVQPPSPGATNSGKVLVAACADVRFSVERGYFSGGFELQLSSKTPGATLLYTLNGSEPNATNATAYSAPIAITRTSVVRATAVKDGLLPSPVATHTYLVGLSSAQRGLPAVSLVTATNNLTGPTGIVGMQGGTRDASGQWVRRLATDYYNPLKRGIEWERPASFEFLTPASNGEFQVDAGLRLHASDWFRPRLLPTSKFSWRLYFRGDYGEGRLRQPFIPASGVEDFDAIVFRAGSNDLNPFVRDEIMRRLLADCGQVSSRGTFVSLFLNGRSSGYYNPVERIESDFLALHHGGSNAWDVMSQGGIVDGDRTDWDKLRSEMAAGTATSDAWYQAMCRRLDVTNFVDYLLVNAYGYTGDWPGNNWRAARERRPGAPWRYYIWDAEWSMGWGGRSVSGNTFSEIPGSDIGNFYSRLRQHPEFRLLFADRVHRHLFHGGALSPTNVNRHFADTTVGLGALITGLDLGITNNWTRSRPAPLQSHLVGQGLFASSNAPVLRQHGGRVPVGFVLTLTNLSGPVWYTTDGSDPRVPFSGRVSANASPYDPARPPVIDSPLVFRARSLAGTNWSALADAVFSTGDPFPPLRIAEVMYQPPGGAEYEFVELRNLSPRPIDVSGFSFDGIDLRFPNGTIIPARATWVLASNNRPAAFASRYPGVPVAASFGGALDNAGEWLVLRDARGIPVDRVRFRPDSGWPAGAAGAGKSLERSDFTRDPSDPAAWRDSIVAGGTPGTANDAPPSSPAIRIDEVFAGNQGRVLRGGHAPDFAELRNLSPASIDLSGWTLRRADRTNRLSLPPGTVLMPGQRFVAWFGEAAPGDVSAAFRLDASGGILVLANASGTTVSTFAHGPQAAEWSCGIVPGIAVPVPMEPSPGADNVPAATASPVRVGLNEWLPNPAPGDDDFVELFNSDPALPVSLHGFGIALSNEVHVVRFPTVIPPRGFAVFRANGGSEPGELPFKLPASSMMLRLHAPDGRVVSEARSSNASENVAYGRLPDGATNAVALPAGGTPGAPNLLNPPPGPQLSELYARSLASNASPDIGRDWVELVNTGTNFAQLGGWSLRVRSPDSPRWTIPDGIALSPGGRFRIRADATLPPSGVPAAILNTGFDLPNNGGVIELAGPDDVVRHRVVFGPQLPGRSVGVEASGTWRLLDQPTPGRTNAAASVTGPGDTLRINEWLASGSGVADFVELHNPEAAPVDVSGWRLTDDPSLAGANRFVLPPLSFVGPASWLVLVADGNLDAGPLHLPFALSAEGESLRLYRPTTNLVDAVTVLPADPGIASGRFPDGGPTLAWMVRPTPGMANLPDADLDDDGIDDDWEQANGLDPQAPSDALLDPDGDGRSNLDEYRAGTNPRDAGSVLALDIAITPAGLVLGFTAQPARSHSLQSRNSWDAPWTPVANLPPESFARRHSMGIPPDAATARFYRVVATRP